jgi:signal transducing adaptor molecule
MFAAKNPFEDIVANATSDELTAENWELNLEVCDKVSSGGESA